MRFGPKDKFWAVTDPTSQSQLCDIFFEASLEDLLLIAKGGGLKIEENPMIFTERGEAEVEAVRRLQALAHAGCGHEIPEVHEKVNGPEDRSE